MQKQRLTCNCPPTLEKSIPVARETNVYCPRRTRRTFSRNIAIRLLRIGKKLSHISLLPLISLRPKTPKKVTEANKNIV